MGSSPQRETLPPEPSLQFKSIIAALTHGNGRPRGKEANQAVRMRAKALLFIVRNS